MRLFLLLACVVCPAAHSAVLVMMLIQALSHVVEGIIYACVQIEINESIMNLSHTETALWLDLLTEW